MPERDNEGSECDSRVFLGVGGRCDGAAHSFDEPAPGDHAATTARCRSRRSLTPITSWPLRLFGRRLLESVRFGLPAEAPEYVRESVPCAPGGDGIGAEEPRPGLERPPV